MISTCSNCTMPRRRPNCCNITKSDLCAQGEGFRLVRDGATALGGQTPGQLQRRFAQSRSCAWARRGLPKLYELVLQLRGRADGRQVADARMAMSVNGGGWLDGTYALAIATILELQIEAQGMEY